MTYIDSVPTELAPANAPDFADGFALMLATDDAWRVDARCRDLAATMTSLFFSDNQVDMAQAKAICRRCTVSDECLSAAQARKEPCGIWGGELFEDGHIVRNKRPRGRPPKVPRPELVVDEVILPDLDRGDEVVKAS